MKSIRGKLNLKEMNTPKTANRLTADLIAFLRVNKTIDGKAAVSTGILPVKNG